MGNKLFIYQINTWVWLDTLSRKYGETITLENVPEVELESLGQLNIDMIWMMGVWQRSPAARLNALKYKHEYRGALPDLTDDDVIGSAYAILDYTVDERIGGRTGLAHLRRRLRQRGLQLMLDFVPNHVAFDHPWIENPELVIHGKPEDVQRRSSDFFSHTTADGRTIAIAHGRDPYFTGWSDTAQLDAFSPKLRRQIVRTLLDIATQCDGVRCDMAMLMLDDVFASTWHGYVGDPLKRPFWIDVINGVKARDPNFLFIAEAYWGKEADLLHQGFDYTYDKTIYDRIVTNDVQKIRQHLLADPKYQERMIRFIENHDEPRAYETIGGQRSFAAATLICTLPGAVLLHDGQFTGRRIKLPVQIKRQPDEVTRYNIEGYYRRLLRETRNPIYRRGTWHLFNIHPVAQHDRTHFNMLAYGWHERGQECRLIVINMTQYASQGHVDLSAWAWLQGKDWRLYDVTDDSEYTRHGETMISQGLHIILAPHESHIFRFEAVRPSQKSKRSLSPPSANANNANEATNTTEASP